MAEKKTGLDLMREPFEERLIGKLPKPTKQQTEALRSNINLGIRCPICGGWHHKAVVHLDYVGHAAITDRLLSADPNWNWEPLATDANGFPAVDENGGMWIKLTVCGVTRLGYGDAAGKSGADAMKERIGDALRNAAMRFGAGLELWHKGDLHGDDGEESENHPEEKKKSCVSDDRLEVAITKIAAGDYPLERLHATYELTEAQLQRLNEAFPQGGEQ